MKSCLDFDYNIEIDDNVLKLDIDDFLDMAVRNNNKRRFLFISKLLGKHLPCRADDMDSLGKLIVDAYLKKRNTSSGVVISFAETGTAIGHSVFDYLDNDYEFIHTTRENIEGLKTLDFLEEHSHATNHNLYFENLKNLKTGEEIILVDDEVTTAKTCINLIKKIHQIYPKKFYTICSILNWVEEENIRKIKQLEKELDCSIKFVYLFKGNFDFELKRLDIDDKPLKQHQEVKDHLKVNYLKLDMRDYIGDKKYLKYTGRFGINKKDQNTLKKIVKEEAKKINVDKNSKVLFLGTEEFMYIPMLFAKNCPGNIYYHSTTRSPIIDIDEKNYPIKSKFEFNSIYNKNVKNYIYNIDKEEYSQVFLFIEFYKNKNDFAEIINIFKQTSVKELNIVCC